MEVSQFNPEMRYGRLGVLFQVVTEDVAARMKLTRTRGVLVTAVDEKGGAKPAGIQPGDVIIMMDGKDINEGRDLPRVVAETPAGRSVEVVIIRNGKEEKLQVKLGQATDAERKKPDDKPASAPERSGSETGQTQVTEPPAALVPAPKDLAKLAPTGSAVPTIGLVKSSGNNQFQVQLELPKTRFKVGERFSINVRANKACWLMLYDVDAHGRVELIPRSAAERQALGNPLKAGETRQFIAEITPPAGSYQVGAVCGQDDLAKLGISEKRLANAAKAGKRSFKLVLDNVLQGVNRDLLNHVAIEYEVER
jgi:hypothetical protein